jgi:hypothetical protein
MNVRLERDGRYEIQFDSTASFSRWFIWGRSVQRIFIKRSSDLARQGTTFDGCTITANGFAHGSALSRDSGESEAKKPSWIPRDVQWIDEGVRATRDGELFLFVN